MIASYASFCICKFIRSRSIEVNLRYFLTFESCFTKEVVQFCLSRKDSFLDICIIRIRVLFIAFGKLVYSLKKKLEKHIV